MKLLFENWRKFLKEGSDLEEKLGIYVKSSFGSWGSVRVVMVDLAKLKIKLQQSQNLDDFLKKVESKDFYKDSVVGYIDAASNEMYAKGPPNMGGSGGECFKTWSVKQSIGRDYGKYLYDALLGWAAENGIYITADRTSITGINTEKGAAGRWKKIDSQTNDEVPPKNDTYLGTFDDRTNTKTLPHDDDCNIYGREYLDKGYKDTQKIEYYNALKNNLETFFSTEIKTLFNEPGFFEKILGKTPQKRTQNVKDKLLSIGQDRFNQFMLEKS